MKTEPLTIDGETADRITALCIKQHRDWMVELVSHRYDKMYVEDLARYTRLIQASNILLSEYFEVPKL